MIKQTIPNVVVIHCKIIRSHVSIEHYAKGTVALFTKNRNNSPNFSLKIILRQFLSPFHKDYLTTNFNLTTKITLMIKILPYT
jgi:hypothetical protein